MWSGSNCKKAKEGIDFPDISAIIRVFVTVQQVCAFTALTVRKLGLEGKNPIGIADLEWIFARNCEGTEQLRVFKQKWFSMGRETSWRQRRRKMKKILEMCIRDRVLCAGGAVSGRRYYGTGHKGRQNLRTGRGFLHPCTGENLAEMEPV